MGGPPEEVAKRFEEQAQVQREQFGMIWAQQESIDILKQMLAHLLKNKKKSPKTKGKKKEVESFSSEDTKREKHLNPKSPKPSSEEKDNSESGSRHSRRMSNLEQCLEALAHRDNLQDVGVVRPYPAEWDTTPCPLRFKAPTYILSMV